MRKEGKLSEWVLSGMQKEKEQLSVLNVIFISCLFIINFNC